MRILSNRIAMLGAVSALSFFACQAAEPEPGQARASESGSVAFVVYDAGETLGLLPVASRLHSVGTEVRWIPLTPWAADLLAANRQSFLDLPDRIEGMPHLESRDAATEVEFWEESLLLNPPALVVSGVVSTAQGQIVGRMREAGIKTRGFHDGFQAPGPGSIAVQIAPLFDELWVPTTLVQEGFLALGFEAVIAGQPSLEAWRRTSEEVDVGVVRRLLGTTGADRVLVFAGQYGPGYAETLDSFLAAIRSTLVADPSLRLVLSHHPRTDGSVEVGALEQAKLPRAAMAPEGLPTMELATAAEVILTWTSTVGVQAAFMGKQVIYYSPPSAFDVDLVNGGAALLADPTTLARLLSQVLNCSKSPESIRKNLMDSGYVVDADSVVAELVSRALGG